MKAILLCALLTGCAAVQQLPSLQYCDSVIYVRDGRSVTITAHCFEAVSAAIPIK